MSQTFSPARIGPYELSHRVVMAPLTRMRSDPGLHSKRADGRVLHPARIVPRMLPRVRLRSPHSSCGKNSAAP